MAHRRNRVATRGSTTPTHAVDRRHCSHKPQHVRVPSSVCCHSTTASSPNTTSGCPRHTRESRRHSHATTPSLSVISTLFETERKSRSIDVGCFLPPSDNHHCLHHHETSASQALLQGQISGRLNLVSCRKRLNTPQVCNKARHADHHCIVRRKTRCWQ